MGGIMVRTSVDDDEIYHVVLELSPDEAISLTPAAAWDWIRYVMGIATAAAYDAAALSQMRALAMDPSAAGMLVQSARKQRSTVAMKSPIASLRMEPCVRINGGEAALAPLADGVLPDALEGFVAIHHQGIRIGQWEIADACQHAFGVLTALEIAVLDTTYSHVLRDSVGLRSGIARGVVADIGKHLDLPDVETPPYDADAEAGDGAGEQQR